MQAFWLRGKTSSRIIRSPVSFDRTTSSSTTFMALHLGIYQMLCILLFCRWLKTLTDFRTVEMRKMHPRISVRKRTPALQRIPLLSATDPMLAPSQIILSISHLRKLYVQRCTFYLSPLGFLFLLLRSVVSPTGDPCKRQQHNLCILHSFNTL